MPIHRKTSQTAATSRKPEISGADRLEYVADLLVELEVIAAQENCETLAGLLVLSQTEARRRSQKNGR